MAWILTYHLDRSGLDSVTVHAVSSGNSNSTADDGVATPPPFGVMESLASTSLSSKTREEASFVSFVLHQEGISSAGAYNLSSYVYDETGWSAKTEHEATSATSHAYNPLALLGQAAWAGLLAWAGAAAGPDGSDVASNQSLMRDEVSTNSYHKHHEGTMAGGNFAFTSYVYDQDSFDSLTLHSQDGSADGAGNVRGDVSNQLDKTEATTIHLHEGGSYIGNVYSIGSYVYDEVKSSVSDSLKTSHDSAHVDANPSLTYAQDSDASSTRSEHSTLSSHKYHEGSYIGTAYSFTCYVLDQDSSSIISLQCISHGEDQGSGGQGSLTLSSTDQTVQSDSLHQEGIYANGSYALTSYSLDQTYRDDFTRHEAGMGALPQMGQLAQGLLAGVNYFGPFAMMVPNDPGATSYTRDDSGYTSYALHEEGTYSAGSYTLSDYELTQSAGGSVALHSTGHQALIGPISADETYALDQEVSSAYTIYRQGTFEAGNYDLASYSYDLAKTDASTLHVDGYHLDGSYTRDESNGHTLALHEEGLTVNAGLSINGFTTTQVGRSASFLHDNATLPTNGIREQSSRDSYTLNVEGNDTGATFTLDESAGTVTERGKGDIAECTINNKLCPLCPMSPLPSFARPFFPLIPSCPPARRTTPLWWVCFRWHPTVAQGPLSDSPPVAAAAWAKVDRCHAL